MQSSVITIYWLLRLVYTVTLKTWTDLQCQCWNGSVRLCIKALNDWGSLPDFQSILNTPDIQLHASFSLEMHEKWKQYALKYQNVVIMLSSKWTESLSEGKKLEFMSIMWFFVKSVNSDWSKKSKKKKKEKKSGWNLCIPAFIRPLWEWGWQVWPLCWLRKVSYFFLSQYIL